MRLKIIVSKFLEDALTAVPKPLQKDIDGTKLDGYNRKERLSRDVDF